VTGNVPLNSSADSDESHALPGTLVDGSASVVEVDARIYMAAERTFLAWIRTGIALMGFGFVVARFGLFLRELSPGGEKPTVPSTGFSLAVGVGMITVGIIVNVVSVIRHRRYVEAIDRNEFRSAFGSTFAILIAILLSAIGIAMAVYLARL
jgi:putative membrane protein